MISDLDNKEKLKLVPFLWLVLSLILGIVLGVWSLLFFALVYFKHFRPYVLVAMFGGALNLFFHSRSSVLEDDSRYKIRCEIGKSINNDIFEVKVLGYSGFGDSIWHNAKFNAVLEFYENVEKDVFRYDIVSVEVYAENIVKTSRDKSIANNLLHKGYVQKLIAYPNQDIKIDKFKLSDNLLASFRLKVRNRLSELLVYSKNSLLLQRMVLGEANKSSKKEQNLFQEAGLAHILAISGLHIGILYVLMNYLLFFMNAVFELRVAKVVIISLLMFLYVWFIDFQPSALRAALMFSLLSYGTFKTTGPMMKYNVLFGAAFVMLLFDTNLLYDIGFQLSFVAVLAIMYGISMYLKHVQVKNMLVNYVLMTCVVTLSAQLATLPLVLYYFGSVSLVSVFANVFVAPLIMPLLVLTLLFLVTGLGFVGELTCLLLDFIVKIAEMFVGIPYSNFQYIDFRIEDLVAVYLAYFLILISVELKNKEKKLSLSK